MGTLINNSSEFTYKPNYSSEDININSSYYTVVDLENEKSENIELDSFVEKSQPFNPQNSSGNNGSSNYATGTTIGDSSNEFIDLPFPIFQNIELDVENYVYNREDKITFTDKDGNTYEATIIDGVWTLENMTNSSGEFISLLNEEFNLIQAVLINNGINIEGISFSKENDYFYIFTDHGDFLYDLEMNRCRVVTNGDEEFLSSNGIYSELNIITSQYGGYQGFLDIFFEDYINDEKIREIINNYFPNENITEEQLQLLFSRMRRIGCGYISCINTIFDNYSYLSDDEWKNMFGFDRMNNNYHQYNYQYLFLDLFLFYQQELNHYENINELLGNESLYESSEDIAISNESLAIEGANGMDSDYLIDIMKKYYDKYNINAEVSSIDCSNENFINEAEQAFRNGRKIIIATENINIYYPYDIDNNELIDDLYMGDFSAHSFTLTGITEDGNWIVSTWGKELIINSEDLIDAEYVEIFSVDYL